MTFLAVGKSKYFFEVVKITENHAKVVNRLFDDGTSDAYVKKMNPDPRAAGKFMWFNLGIALFVYKESTEEPIPMTDVIGRVYCCERICWNHETESGARYEATIKIPLKNYVKNTLTDVGSKPSDIFACLIKHPISLQSSHTSVAIEFPRSLTWEEMNHHRGAMMKMMGIDYVKVYDTVCRGIKQEGIIKILRALAANKPKTIGVMLWRNMLSQDGMIYKSHKPNGHDGLAFVSRGNGCVILSKGGIFIGTPKFHLFGHEAIVDRRAFRAMTGIINSCNYIIHGEMIHRTFVIFATIPFERPSQSWALSSKMEGIKRHMMPYTSGMTIIEKKYYNVDLQMEPASYQTDGIVIVKDSGKPYTATQVLKIKPKAENTIDVRLNTDGKGGYYPTCIFSGIFPQEMPVRMPLLTTGRLQDVLPVAPSMDGYVDGAVYECAINSNGELQPRAIRLDKIHGNSLIAGMDILSAMHLPDWNKTIKDKSGEGFYEKRLDGNNETRYLISKAVHSSIADFLRLAKVESLTDIGGGKIGYLKVLTSFARQLSMYFNIEKSMIEIFAGIGRICNKGDETNYHIMTKSHFLCGAMELNSTLKSIPAELSGVFDGVMSVFALHHGCADVKSMTNTVKLIDHLTKPAGNVMIVVYNFDKIRNKFAALAAENKEQLLDLGIVRFRPNDEWSFITELEFQNYKPFVEPAPSIVTFTETMLKASFELTEMSEYGSKGPDALEYICALKFVKGPGVKSK